jgi:hypothetical protein
MAPGNADMNNSDYQDLPAISSHWLIAMLDSPAACWRKYLDPGGPPRNRPPPSGSGCWCIAWR